MTTFRWGCLLSAAALLAPVPAFGQNDPAAQLRPFLDAHCMSCHDAEAKKGGLDLTAPIDWAKADDRARWVRVHDRVAKGEMPPGKRKPAADETAPFLAGLSRGLTAADAARKGTVLRRLNRVEYEYTLHDLLGIRAPLADRLPEDGKAQGFDTVGAALDLSGAQLQRYMDAADAALTAATRTGPRPENRKQTVRFDEGKNADHLGKHWLKRPDGAVVFFTAGAFPPITPSTFRAAADGKHRLRLTGYAYQSADPVTFAVYLVSQGREAASRLLGYYTLSAGEPQTLDLTAELSRGETVRLIPQGLRVPGNIVKLDLTKYPGPGLAIQSLEVEGPLHEDWPGRGHRLLWGDLPTDPPAGFGAKATPGAVRSKDPAADAERLLRAFVPAAFRRPVGPERVAPYVALAKAELAAGVSFERAMRTAYQAVLCSPHFLYLVEPAGKLDGYAVASRLSYFLWRSAPDAALLAAAGHGELSTPSGLRAQTERLLKDPKADRFVADFVGQWLNLRDIDATTPDEKLYPEFDPALRHAMVRETELFFAAVLKADRPVTEFLHSDWTVLNERLARHYGVPGVKGPEFRTVKLPPAAHRGGVLTHASVLKVSANGTTTSPVTRGAWVLERILGEPPQPPPPGVPGVEPDIRGATTIREQLDKHRNSASCAGCHKVIDPPGFALERYDVIGGWRDRYRAVPDPKIKAEVLTVGNRRVALGPKVDASGELPDGRRFAGPDEFKALLLKDPDRFTRALTEKLVVFGTGRETGFSDRPAVTAVVRGCAAGGRGFRDLVHRVIQSELFLTK